MCKKERKKQDAIARGEKIDSDKKISQTLKRMEIEKNLYKCAFNNPDKWIDIDDWIRQGLSRERVVELLVAVNKKLESLKISRMSLVSCRGLTKPADVMLAQALQQTQSQDIKKDLLLKALSNYNSVALDYDAWLRFGLLAENILRKLASHNRTIDIKYWCRKGVRASAILRIVIQQKMKISIDVFQRLQMSEEILNARGIDIQAWREAGLSTAEILMAALEAKNETIIEQVTAEDPQLLEKKSWAWRFRLVGHYQKDQEHALPPAGSQCKEGYPTPGIADYQVKWRDFSYTSESSLQAIAVVGVSSTHPDIPYYYLHDPQNNRLYEILLMNKNLKKFYNMKECLASKCVTTAALIKQGRSRQRITFAGLLLGLILCHSRRVLHLSYDLITCHAFREKSESNKSRRCMRWGQQLLWLLLAPITFAGSMMLASIGLMMPYNGQKWFSAWEMLFSNGCGISAWCKLPRGHWEGKKGDPIQLYQSSGLCLVGRVISKKGECEHALDSWFLKRGFKGALETVLKSIAEVGMRAWFFGEMVCSKPAGNYRHKVFSIQEDHKIAEIDVCLARKTADFSAANLGVVANNEDDEKQSLPANPDYVMISLLGVRGG